MLNHIVLMGRLTRDPELRATNSGVSVASFSLAVDRDTKNANGTYDTDFIDIVAWRQTGEFVSKYFTKGSMAIVLGRLQIRDWTDRDGNKRRSAEVIADRVYFGESKRRDDGESAFREPSRFADLPTLHTEKTQPGGFTEIDDADGELPF